MFPQIFNYVNESCAEIQHFHDGQLWKQLIEVAMGIHPAPSFANIYLAIRIDKAIKSLGLKYGKNGMSVFKILKLFWMTCFRYLMAQLDNYIKFMRK